MYSDMPYILCILFNIYLIYYLISCFIYIIVIM